MSKQQYTEEDDENVRYSNKQQSSSSYRPKLVPDDSISGRQLWMYGFCGCIILSILLFFGFFVFSWHRGGVDHGHVDQMIAELNDDNTQQIDTKNMVSFSALATPESQSQRLIKNNNRLSLCFADLLRADTEDPTRSTLVINVDQLSEDRNPYYFMLDLKLTLSFDVNAVQYMRNLQQFEMSRRYMTVAYLISSSYSHFSTVKLIETGLDTKNRALIRTNEIILCSDNPANQNVRGCGSQSESGVLFVKNTKLLTMSRMVPWQPQGSARKNTTRESNGRTSIPVAPKTDDNDDGNSVENGQYDIMHTDENINAYKVSEDFTKDVRMYNIVFYRQAPSTGDEASQRYSSFREVPVLAIKPSKCK